MVDERAVQRNGYADYGAAEIVDAMAGVAIGGSGGRRRSRLAEGIGGRAWRREARTFFERTELRAACGVLCGLRSVCVAEPRGRIWACVPGGDGVREASDWRSAWRRTGSD